MFRHLVLKLEVNGDSVHRMQSAVNVHNQLIFFLRIKIELFDNPALHFHSADRVIPDFFNVAQFSVFQQIIVDVC